MKNNLYIKLINFISTIIFKKPKIINKNEKNIDEPVIYVCNHAKALGPVLTSKYLKGNHRPWIIGYILDKKKAPNFIFYDFLNGESKKCKWLFKIISHITAFFLVPILKAYKGIPVWHDQRIITTYRESIKTLKNNESLVIFPESPEKYSKNIFKLQSGFIDTARLYYNNTKKEIKFIPLYVFPSPNTMLIGKPIQYDHTKTSKVERENFALQLTAALDELANTIPNHKVIPFLDENWFNTYGKYKDNMLNYWKKFD